jgi:hypothetical protein
MYIQPFIIMADFCSILLDIAYWKLVVLSVSHADNFIGKASCISNSDDLMIHRQFTRP